jgi:hypothetical protein
MRARGLGGSWAPRRLGVELLLVHPIALPIAPGGVRSDIGAGHVLAYLLVGIGYGVPVPKHIRALVETAGPPSGRQFYEGDEHEWIAAKISVLASGHFNRLDRANFIEYLTEMTVRDRRELQSRLIVLLHHLLKVRFQPKRPTRSWVTTIIEQQSEIHSIIDNVPALGPQAEAITATAYPDADRRAVRETGIEASRFPATLPRALPDALGFDPPEPPDDEGQTSFLTVNKSGFWRW